MRRRIIAGIGANSFGMAITIGIQLASLPLFLYCWDTATYGTWLMLSAVPAYLSMADVGMVTAAGNKMTMAMGNGKIKEANQTFQSAQLFMSIVCGGIAVIAIPMALFVPLPGLDTVDKHIALAALVAGVLLSLFGGLTEQIFRSTGRYATGTILGNSVRLSEWIGLLLGLLTGGTFASVAVGGLIARLAGLIFGILLASRSMYGLKLGVKEASLAEIKIMIKPSLSFMALPLANAMSFQGVTLLVGVLLGPIVVATFNTYRTIARVAVQVNGVLSYALWPEFSRLYGRGERAALAHLYNRSFLISAIQSIVLFVVLFFVSPWLLQIWTHGVIKFNARLVTLMLSYAAVSSLWHVPRGLLMSTNQHAELALWSIFSGALAVVLAWVLGSNFYLLGIIIAMLVSELFIACYCTWRAHGVIESNDKIMVA